MFEWLVTLGAAWRTVLHVSEWSGLSIGALAAGAALIYLVPASRKLVILAAIGVVIGWVCLLHGDRVGRADVEAQWADARRAAIAATADRDQLAELTLEAKYQPQLIDLQKQADARKAKADAYERQIITLLAKNQGARNVCELGLAADRMRHK